MDTLEQIEALREAHEIIRSARQKLYGGPDAIWNKAFHATEYLNKQIAELLKEEAL